MNIQDTIKSLTSKEYATLVECINEVAEDYNFSLVRTFAQVLDFCENCEIGEEMLQS